MSRVSSRIGATCHVISDAYVGVISRKWLHIQLKGVSPSLGRAVVESRLICSVYSSKFQFSFQFGELFYCIYTTPSSEISDTSIPTENKILLSQLTADISNSVPPPGGFIRPPYPPLGGLIPPLHLSLGGFILARISFVP